MRKVVECWLSDACGEADSRLLANHSNKETTHAGHSRVHGHGLRYEKRNKLYIRHSYEQIPSAVSVKIICFS